LAQLLGQLGGFLALVTSGRLHRPRLTARAAVVQVCALAEASLGQGFLLSSMGSSRVRRLEGDPAKRRSAGADGRWPVEPLYRRRLVLSVWRIASEIS
jgi:hypothetical protein